MNIGDELAEKNTYAVNYNWQFTISYDQMLKPVGHSCPFIQGADTRLNRTSILIIIWRSVTKMYCDPRCEKFQHRVHELKISFECCKSRDSAGCTPVARAHLGSQVAGIVGWTVSSHQKAITIGSEERTLKACFKNIVNKGAIVNEDKRDE